MYAQLLSQHDSFMNRKRTQWEMIVNMIHKLMKVRGNTDEGYIT